jgi:hypothetical protein
MKTLIRSLIFACLCLVVAGSAQATLLIVTPGGSQVQAPWSLTADTVLAVSWTQPQLSDWSVSTSYITGGDPAQNVEVTVWNTLSDFTVAASFWHGHFVAGDPISFSAASAPGGQYWMMVALETDTGCLGCGWLGSDFEPTVTSGVIAPLGEILGAPGSAVRSGGVLNVSDSAMGIELGGLTFTAEALSGMGYQVSGTPEPSTYIFIGCGLAALGIYRRRRRTA